MSDASAEPGAQTTSRPAIRAAAPASFSALRHRNFRLFIFGQGVSVIGTWMQTTAQAWFVLTLTGSPFLLGTVAALQWIPVTLFSLVGGVVADRLPKRRVLIATQTMLMIQALTLAVLTWTGVAQYWHVAVLAGLMGLVNSLDMPTRQSFFVEMVDRDDLMNAIALNSALVNAGRIIGPAAAGLLIAAAGVPAAFLINGLSFVGVIAALAAMRTPRFEPAPPMPLLGRIREGLTYVRETPAILTTLVLLAAVSLFVLNFSTLVPVLARQVLRGDARTFGLLMSALGSGSFVAALTLAAASRRGPSQRTILAGAVTVSVMVVALGFASVFAVAAVFAFLGGAGMIVFSAASNSFVQVLVPDELRGRVMAIYSMLFAGTSPVGALLVGGVMDLWGPRAGFLIAGSCGLIAVAGVSWWRARLGAPRSSMGSE